jgi:hypothetical protein
VKAKVHKLVRYGLALGTVGYGVASMMRSDRLAVITDQDEETVRYRGFRDITAGMVLLTAQNPGPLLRSLALTDFRDGLRLRRARPRIAPIAFAWGLLALVAFFTRGWGRPAPPCEPVNPRT